MRNAATTLDGRAHRTRVWIVAPLSLALLPHVARLPTWVTAFFIAVALSLVLPLGRRRRAAPAWLVGLAVVAGSVGVLLQFGTLMGHEAALALLVYMLAVKLLELRAWRDAMVVMSLSYFAAGTHFLFSESLIQAAYAVVVVVVVTAAMIRVTHPSSARGPADDVRLAAMMLGQAAPLMLVLFVFVPRGSGALWQRPEEARASVTGLSETMSPGAISRLAQSPQVAFRVAFHGPLPPPEKRYWRGPVFWYTDGLSWSAGKEWQQRLIHLRPRGTRPAADYEGDLVRHTITLEPHGERWLLALDLPVDVSEPAFPAADAQWVAAAPVTERLRYEALSVTDFAVQPDSIRELRRCLQLPRRVSPRAAALARGWAAEAEDDEDLVRRALGFFQASGFRYTLTPPAAERDFLDEFLFETRAGFCEHFAAAFALLMRLAGIPARLVTGYMGGETNPLGGYLIVRQSHAHAWCEVWLRGKGWTRVDPTVEASPQRLIAGEGAAPALLDAAFRARLFRSRFFKLARFAADAVSHAWNQWVLGYGPALQMDLLARLGVKHPTRRDLLAALWISVGGVALALTLWMLLRAARSTDPVLAAYQRFCDRMAAAGLTRRPFEGPRDFQCRIAAQRPEFAEAAQRVTDLYVALRYARTATGGTPEDLRLLVRGFRTR